MSDPGMFWAALAMTWVLACAVVLIVVWHLRSKRRMEREGLIHEERMKAMEKGIPLPEFPGLDEEHQMERSNRVFTPPSLNPRWPLGFGALMIASGLGWSAAMLSWSEEHMFRLWPLGMIGVFLGVGFMLFYRLTRSPEK